jgi:hypothetical protein
VRWAGGCPAPSFSLGASPGQVGRWEGVDWGRWTWKSSHLASVPQDGPPQLIPELDDSAVGPSLFPLQERSGEEI